MCDALQMPDVSLELRPTGHPANGKVRAVVKELWHYKAYKKEIEREYLDGRRFVLPEQVRHAVAEFKKRNPYISDDLQTEVQREWFDKYVG